MLSSGASSLFGAALIAADRQDNRPNVIVIVSDDLGYHDLGFQGSKDIKTPHLDALAKGGVRFTNAYVTGPVCGPTRAGLLSGRYQQSHSYDSNPGPQQGLNLKEATLADVLHQSGYKTGAIGKWHLGQLPEYRPLKRGFDEFFGFYGAMHSYVPGPVADNARMIGELPRRARDGSGNGPGRGAGAPIGTAWFRLIDDTASKLELTQVESQALNKLLESQKQKLAEVLRAELGDGPPNPQKVGEVVRKKLPEFFAALKEALPAEKLSQFQDAVSKGPQGFGGLGGGNLEGSQPGKLIRNAEEIEEPGYLTEVFGQQANSFVERHKEAPFFLYLCFNASHSPLQPPQKYLDRFPELSGKRQAYAATTAALDDAVGSLVAKLREHNVEQQTLIYYTNDNGGPIQDITADNSPLGGAKGSLWEGGVRVPSFVYWKGKIKSGERSHPVISLDIFPTAIAATGVKTDKSLDGANLLPSLTGASDAGLEDRTLYWRSNNTWAVRRGSWKLTKPERNESVQLFDLSKDVSESRDVAGENPTIVASLQQAWNAWNEKNLPVPSVAR